MLIIIILLHGLSLPVVWFMSGLRSKPVEKIVDTVKKTTVDENYNEETENKKKTCSKNCLVFDIYDRIAILFCSSALSNSGCLPLAN